MYKHVDGFTTAGEVLDQGIDRLIETVKENTMRRYNTDEPCPECGSKLTVHTEPHKELVSIEGLTCEGFKQRVICGGCKFEHHQAIAAARLMMEDV